MKSKLISIIAASVLACALFGCGKTNNSNGVLYSGGTNILKPDSTEINSYHSNNFTLHYTTNSTNRSLSREQILRARSYAEDLNSKQATKPARPSGPYSP